MSQYTYAITAMAVLMMSIACSDVPVLQPDAGGGADAPPQSPDAAPSDDAPPPDASPPDAPSSCITSCTQDGDLLDCEAGGEVVACPLACVDTPTPHCGQLVPSNGLYADLLVDVSGELVVPYGKNATIDTGSGAISGSQVSRAPGTGLNAGIRFTVLSNGLAVFAVKNMDIQGQLEVVGTRPLVILSEEEASVSGFIAASANGRIGGPGGGNGGYGTQLATGCAPGANGVDLDSNDKYSGGGGGGLGKNGAPGGQGYSNDPGGAGGDISACPGTSLVPLTGGSGGGRGYGSYIGYHGGGGGGAVQITSYTKIDINGGIIGAPGAGGDEYGGGGGSGGAILLEAPVISLNNAILAANGGGGGDDDSGGGGEYGRLDEQPASGDCCTGGDGGSLIADAQPGTTYSSRGGGGGGGAVGIIHLNVPATGLTQVDTLTSPAESRSDPATE